MYGKIKCCHNAISIMILNLDSVCNAFECEITVNEILDPGKEERGGNP